MRWPAPTLTAILTLTSQYLAAGRDKDAYGYFRERAAAASDQPIFLALEGVFQVRMAGQVFLPRRIAWVKDAIAKLDRAAHTDHPVARYLRGVTLAELPARFGRAGQAVGELEWVLQQGDTLPPGLRRSVYRGLAQAFTTLERRDEATAALAQSGYGSLSAALPQFTTDFSVSARDGFRFRPPRLVEMAPRVHVAQGYDFADIAFVLTDAGIVAVDAGTTEATARAAVDAVRRRSSAPITHVILTHAHWDHIGGLAALRAPSTRVIGQAGFAEELRLVNDTGVPFRCFFGNEARRRYEVVPDHLVGTRETLTVGGTEFVLYPAHGGETADALLIHLPETDLVFVGDAFMPYLGAPFLPEGSAEGLFETIALIRSLNPRTLVHGHPPLTDLFTMEALPAFETALHDVYGRTLEGIGDGRTLTELLEQNWLPTSLRDHPEAVMPFLVIRDNFIQRVTHQRTGYWKPDGDGIEVVAPREWAGALNLLAGGEESAFVRSIQTLLDQRDDVLALKLVDVALLNNPGSRALLTLRPRVLDRLRVRHQGVNPFKFIVYSDWAGADLPPVSEGRLALLLSHWAPSAREASPSAPRGSLPRTAPPPPVHLADDPALADSEPEARHGAVHGERQEIGHVEGLGGVLKRCSSTTRARPPRLDTQGSAKKRKRPARGLDERPADAGLDGAVRAGRGDADSWAGLLSAHPTNAWTPRLATVLRH